MMHNPPIESTQTGTPEDGADDKYLVINRGVAVMPTPEGTKTIVRVHPTAKIAMQGVLVGKKRGPIGENCIVEEDSILLGALFANVHLGKNSIVGHGSRIGDKSNKKGRVGEIKIAEGAVIGGRVRIYSPALGQTTRIGAGSQIDPQASIGENGRESKPRGIEIGARAVIGKGVVLRPGCIIGEGAEIQEGYTIAEDVKIPDGIRLVKREPGVSDRLRLVGANWQKNLKRFIEVID